MFRESIGFRSSSRVRASLESIVSYPVHMHTGEIEIIWVLDGSVSISDSALNHRLTPGDVYIFNAKDPHKIMTTSEKNIILTVQIDINYYKRHFKRLDTIYFICDSFIYKEQLTAELQYLRFLLSGIYTEYSCTNRSDALLENMTQGLLAFLMEQFQYYTYSKSMENSYDIVRRQKSQANDPYFNRIYEIIDYIYINFRQKILLKDIANQEFLSIYYLSRYIKKACGLSFSELVAIARCEEAERLLGATTKTIDEIALEVGFSNRKHLNINFKKWFHQNPTEYRKALYLQLGSYRSIEYNDFDHNLAASILNSYTNR
jgi:xylan 1,4-beta-xylosidase